MVWPSCITTMPKPAKTMASHVRIAMGWPINQRAIKAVNKGPTEVVTNTCATDVSDSATMKAVNITAQHRPDIQSARGAKRRSAKALGPRNPGSMTASDSKVKKLRQNVISRPRANSICLDATPATDQSRVTKTINHTACPWDRRVAEPVGLDGLAPMRLQRPARLRSCSFR